MPSYNFLCEKCDHITKDLQPMPHGGEHEKVACEECGGVTEHTFANPGCMQGGDKERTSFALGCHQSQIDDGSIFKVHPGATFDKDCNMVLKNLTEQKQRLHERNWVDRNSFG
jgi:putative FmdB family regulatory protein